MSCRFSYAFRYKIPSGRDKTGRVSCLRMNQRGGRRARFAVKGSDDGEVKLSYLHAKRILDYYKKLCCGKNEVLTEIVAEFNKETDEGHNMKKYSDLLETAIQELIGRKQEIGVASLFSRGGTTMQTSLFYGIEEFELITFLVLR